MVNRALKGPKMVMLQMMVGFEFSGPTTGTGLGIWVNKLFYKKKYKNYMILKNISKRIRTTSPKI
jgi:hypothetical protein